MVKDHCLVFYDGRKLNITAQEFLGVAAAMENLDNKFLEIRGAKYPINDIKFAGSRMDWAESCDKEKVPAGQNTLENRYGQFLLTGDVAKLPENFREFAKKIWDDHKARRPQIDADLRAGNCIHCHEFISEAPTPMEGQYKIAHARCTQKATGANPLEKRPRDFPERVMK